MSRPIKQGLSYFPLDVDMDMDDKIMLIESRYGVEGYAVVIKLLSKIYNNGYFYPWTEKEILLLAKRTGLEEKKINDIVEDCVRWEFFDKDKFNKYKILTSKGIQKRYFEAIKRRFEINVCKEYTINGVFDNKYYENVNIYSINDDKKPQSKVKKIESRVKKIESKEDNSSDLASKSEQKPYFDFESNSWININDEYKKIWNEAYPACDIKIELNRMKAWILGAGAKGHKKNWVAFIGRWLSNSQDKGGTIKTKFKNNYEGDYRV